MKIVNPVIPDQIRLEAFPLSLRLNHGGELYANPAVTISLDATGKIITNFLLFDEHNLNEFALHWVPKRAGAVKTRRSKSGSTLTFSATPLLLRRPDLRVEAGRIRLLPFRIDQTDEGALFVLDLTKEENIPSSRRPAKHST